MQDKIDKFLKHAETVNNRLENTTAIKWLIKAVNILSKENRELKEKAKENANVKDS